MCGEQQVEVKPIRPDKPMRNDYIKGLNRTFRKDVLDAYVLDTFEEVRIFSDEW